MTGRSGLMGSRGGWSRAGWSRGGWGRVDLLVVAVCVLLLGALSLVFVGQSRYRAQQVLCSARQFRTALGVRSFNDEFLQLPGYREVQAVGADGEVVRTSWVFPTLPFLIPLDQSLVLRSSGGERRTRGESIEELAEGETVVLERAVFQTILDRYGPGGPDATRGKRPEVRLVQLICPSDSTAAGRTNAMSWRVNTGLPDRPGTGLPVDWPANGLFLDMGSERSALLNQGLGDWSLEVVEQADGLDYTVLLSESTGQTDWTDDLESKVGMVWGCDESLGLESGRVDPWELRVEAWRLSGVGQESCEVVKRWGDVRPVAVHGDSFNVAFASGRVETLSREIDPLVWAQMMRSKDSAAGLPGSEGALPQRLGGPTADDSMTVEPSVEEPVSDAPVTDAPADEPVSEESSRE